MRWGIARWRERPERYVWVVPMALAGLLIAASVHAGEGSPGAGADSPAAIINVLVEQAWQDAGISPSEEATDAEFLRRAYLDIVGRIPTVEEATGFLASKEEGKRAKLVAYLLEHPDYPKNFGTVWANLLVGRRPEGRRVDRDELEGWLRRQFAANRPWNEIARELITAEGSNEENGAVNFSLAHMQDDAVNLTSYTTRLFLGEQIQCTQCHDHPSNDWKQEDFWGINAFFKGLRSEVVREPNAAGQLEAAYVKLIEEPTEAFSSFEKRNAVIGIAFPTFLDGTKISQGTDVDRRDALGRYITGPDNDQFARAFVNRMWGHFMGRGIVHPVDDFGEHNPPSNPELMAYLADQFEQSGYDIQALIGWITASRPYHLTSVMTAGNANDDVLFSHMLLKPMTPEQLFDSLLVATDAHKAGGDARSDERRRRWMDQFIFTFGNDEATEVSGFQGTIPQALMMMNGDLMARATDTRPGSFLARLRDRAMSQSRARPEAYMVNMMYLAALSRPPSPAERSAAGKLLTTDPNPLHVMEDIFWALLNSNEFILNH